MTDELVNLHRDHTKTSVQVSPRKDVAHGHVVAMLVLQHYRCGYLLALTLTLTLPNPNPDPVCSVCLSLCLASPCVLKPASHVHAGTPACGMSTTSSASTAGQRCRCTWTRLPCRMN